MRSAVSFASEPELVKNTCSKPGGARLASFSASFTAGTLVVLKKLL